MRNTTFKYILAFFIMFNLVSCSSSKKSVTNAKNLTEKEKIELKNSFFEASREKALGNYTAAQKYYEQCINIDPNHSASIYELANIYQSQSRAADAVLFYEKAAKIEPNNKWYLQSLAAIYEQTKQFEKSATVYLSLANKYPNEISYYENEALMYLYQNDLKKVLKVYDNIENRFGIVESVSLQKQKVLLIVKKYDEAILEAKKLLQSKPKSPKYYNNLANVYRKAGQKQKATETYKNLLKIDPDNAFVQLSMATYYLESGENKKGEELLRKVFSNPAINEKNKMSILINAVIKQNSAATGFDPLVFELIDSIKVAHPKSANIYSLSGDLNYEVKKNKEALADYQKSLKLDPNQFLVWNRLLFIYSEKEDWNAMYNEGTAAIELFPSQGTLYYLTGIAASQLKKYQEAVEVLEMGKDFVIGNNELLALMYLTLGDTYNNLKLYSKSDLSFDKCLTYDPNNLVVLNNYSYYLSLRAEKLEQAKLMSKRTIELEPESAIYLDTYAWILFVNKEYEEAKKYMELALINGGNTQGTLVEHYGDILFHLGEEEEALKNWKLANTLGGASNSLEQKIKSKTYIP